MTSKGISAPRWFALRSNEKKKANTQKTMTTNRRVALREVPMCAECGARMSATPDGLVCYECGSTHVS